MVHHTDKNSKRQSPSECFLARFFAARLNNLEVCVVWVIGLGLGFAARFRLRASRKTRLVAFAAKSF